MTEEEKKKESGEISRREFLKDAGLVVGGAAIGSTVLLAACGGEETTTTVTETATQTQTATKTQTQTKIVTIEVPVPEEKTKLTVNGVTYEFQVEPHWTLLEVLRRELGLTGTKEGCNQGSCGACTIILDGMTVLACTLLAIECDGKEITTIEGLADGEKLNPIQSAFIENRAFECGFCTPGMIMSAKALLDRNPNPTEEDVRQALAGNLCRCAVYPQIFRSVLAVAENI